MTNINAYTRGSVRLSGIKAFAHMAQTWGVSLDELTTQEYRDASAKAKAFTRFRSEQAADDALTYIINHDEKQWAKGMTTIATGHTTATYVDGIYPQVSGALQQRADNMLHNAEAMQHVATVLDIDSAVEAVTDAATHLGTHLYDPARAAQSDPQRFANYMNNIAKIVSLDAVLRSRAERAALFADIPPLPSMKFERDGYGTRTNHYSREDVAKHQAAHDWKRAASGDDVEITRLAVGDFAPLRLSVSLDPAVLAKRAARLAGAGETEQI